MQSTNCSKKSSTEKKRFAFQIMIWFIFKTALTNRYFSTFFFWLKIKDCDTIYNTISEFCCAIAFWSSSKSYHLARAKFENQKFVKFDEKQYEFSSTKWFSIWFCRFSKIFKSNKSFDDTAFQSAIFFCMNNFSPILIRDNRSIHKRLPLFISKIEQLNIHNIYQRIWMNIASLFFSKFLFFNFHFHRTWNRSIHRNSLIGFFDFCVYMQYKRLTFRRFAIKIER